MNSKVQVGKAGREKVVEFEGDKTKSFCLRAVLIVDVYA